VIGNPIFNRLPARFRWTIHNVIAHPVSEILWQLGLVNLSDWVHEITVPEHEVGMGQR
jgi:hypothetical protein